MASAITCAVCWGVLILWIARNVVAEARQELRDETWRRELRETWYREMDERAARATIYPTCDRDVQAVSRQRSRARVRGDR